MVLDDLPTALGAAAIVFFFLLGVLYLGNPEIASKTWYGILFVLIAMTILLVLVGQPGLAGISIAVIAALIGKDLLERRGIGT